MINDQFIYIYKNILCDWQLIWLNLSKLLMSYYVICYISLFLHKFLNVVGKIKSNDSKSSSLWFIKERKD